VIPALFVVLGAACSMSAPRGLLRGVGSADGLISILNEKDLAIGNFAGAIEATTGIQLLYARDAYTNDRTLLSAPMIFRRFTGEYTGSMIAEFALASPGEFQFKSHDVFNRVSILPQVANTPILTVE